MGPAGLEHSWDSKRRCKPAPVFEPPGAELSAGQLGGVREAPRGRSRIRHRPWGDGLPGTEHGRRVRTPPKGCKLKPGKRRRREGRVANRAVVESAALANERRAAPGPALQRGRIPEQHRVGLTPGSLPPKAGLSAPEQPGHPAACRPLSPTQLHSRGLPFHIPRSAEGRSILGNALFSACREGKQVWGTQQSEGQFHWQGCTVPYLAINALGSNYHRSGCSWGTGAAFGPPYPAWGGPWELVPRLRELGWS